MKVDFTTPAISYSPSEHRESAAKRNDEVTSSAVSELREILGGQSETRRVLLKAAAGAGKSVALRRMAEEALEHTMCMRVGVTAFANKQLFPLAESLGNALGADAVCLYVSAAKASDIPDSTRAAVNVAGAMNEIPADAQVVVCTSHMFGRVGHRLKNQLGAAQNGDTLFDVLFVDEAWQMPLHLYKGIERLAPVSVGVGDVGQLPPLDASANPWRGDRGYNPYRAWPTAHEGDHETWTAELPAVWRPTAEQLSLWRAFYGDWDSLDCVSAPGDRSVEFASGLTGAASDVWSQVGSGVPTLVEVSGLEDAEAADIDQPLLAVVEDWLDGLLAAGFVTVSQNFDPPTLSTSESRSSVTAPGDDVLIAVLATRNQAVEDAQDMVDRLRRKHGLSDGVIVASTVDSWQGQTNAITVAIHPLSGASELDTFNSAFGRLAVTCTRATHGLLLVARSGLDELLSTAPPRPGTPFGEPGTRQLPRQTHGRILETFARGTYYA